ncbi:COMM domain-containing protein 7 [Histomonas meleagridis]|uniref:COMM domain-containing protein 7 n=1 Tax=Histomonas meleagridis TaxID=135588 RepID=UPI003559FF96|nr:COMM domain-containing protein 7 [Histomonas meleagridis]KAH0796116.1 COMM domain-containing protein 7 [Histomonas meleagridis]
MLSQQQIRDNIPLLNSISEDGIRQICSSVIDSIQYQTNLQTQLNSLNDIADISTLQNISDTISSLVYRLLQSRSATTDSADTFKSLGISDELSSALSSVVNSRIDSLCKDMASRSSGDKLSDLEWRFGLTAASSSENGSAFVQMKLSFENNDPVSVEMGMKEFYEFAADIKHIQQQMENSLNI